MREYLDAVNEMFEYRGYDAPIDFSLKHEPPALFYENVKTWEEEPNRRTHMTPEFLAEFIRRAALESKTSKGLSFVEAMLDFALLGRFTGIRLAEYGQKTQFKVDYHELPNGKARIMKAFCREDFVFVDKQGRRVADPSHNAWKIHAVRIRWRVQKNRRNGQVIEFVRDAEHPDLCAVMAALRIYHRSERLGQTKTEPMGVYHERKRMRYITGDKIAKLFKDIARTVYPDISPSELSKFSAHIIRVTACVLLQIADKPQHFIQTRLRWEGESYKLYLRNTSVLAHRHLEANAGSNAAIAAYRLPASLLTAPTEASTPQVPVAEHGTYVEIN